MQSISPKRNTHKHSVHMEPQSHVRRQARVKREIWMLMADFGCEKLVAAFFGGLVLPRFSRHSTDNILCKHN